MVLAFDYILHVIFGNFAVGRHDRMHAAIIEAAHMTTSDSQIDTADFDIGHLLGFNDGVADILLGSRGISNFSFAHAARAGLAKADDIQRALRAQFTYDGADFGRADFQANNDGRWVKHVFSLCV